MTMKKWLSLLLALVLVVGCMPAAALAAEELTNRETGLELEEVLEETQEPYEGIPEQPETEATEETESTEETDPTEEPTRNRSPRKRAPLRSPLRAMCRRRWIPRRLCFLPSMLPTAAPPSPWRGTLP